jgi:hypothetical protein
MASSNSFRDRVNGARERSMTDAFNFLSASSPANDVLNRITPDSSLQAFDAASSFGQAGLNQVQGFGDALNQSLAQGAARGTQMVGQAAAHNQRLEAEQALTKQAKKAANRQKRSSAIGGVLGVAKAALGIFCERRLKIDITPLNPREAWAAIRDIPLYAFRYKHQPNQLAFGPMVDEVRDIDASLLTPMDEEARLAGIADGLPISGIDMVRRNAYESAALQLALQRIEALEQRIKALEGNSQLSIAA